jgi:hypothetical protein
MSDAYILNGIEDEYLLVVKAEDQETILSIIDSLSTSRSKWIKELAQILEESLHDTGSRRNSSKTRPKNSPKGSNGDKHRRTKTANTKHRSKPRT